MSNETRSEAWPDASELVQCGLANAPGMAENVGTSMPKASITLQIQAFKHHHTLLNGFGNETIIKVCNVDSKKKNSVGKTCCYQPSILLYPPSDGFRGQETGRYRRRPDGTEKLNIPGGALLTTCRA